MKTNVSGDVAKARLKILKQIVAENNFKFSLTRELQDDIIMIIVISYVQKGRQY